MLSKEHNKCLIEREPINDRLIMFSPLNYKFQNLTLIKCPTVNDESHTKQAEQKATLMSPDMANENQINHKAISKR